MNFQLEINTVLNLVTVAGIAWFGKFLYRLDHRLTRIETLCRMCHKNILTDEKDNEN